MAIFNEVLVARFNKGFQKIFGMKGPSAVKQLAGEIAPVFPIPVGVEYRFLEDWHLWAASIGTNPIAAQDSVVRISNPRNSGVLVVIEQITFTSDPAAATRALIELGDSGTDLANAVTAASRDRRSNPANAGPNSVAHVTWGNNIGQGANFIADAPLIPAGQTILTIADENQEYVLPPDTQLQVRSGSVNVSIQVGFKWRERALEPSEIF